MNNAPFNGVGKKPIVSPSTRFTPDVGEDKKIKVDERTGDFLSGTFEIKLERAYPDGIVEEVSSFSQHMSFNKYRSIREDIDSMNVEQLMDYFPQLRPADMPKKIDPKDVEIAELKLKLEQALEAKPAKVAKEVKEDAKTTPSESKEAAGKADGTPKK